MRPIALASVVALAAACPGPGGDVPETDRCDQVVGGVVESLELGTGDLQELFVPWTDGDEMRLTHGPQGGDMLRLRLRLRGGSECVAQESVVLDAQGQTIATETTPVHAYDQGDGVRVTRDIWLILTGSAVLDAGDAVTVRSTVLGTTESRALVIAE